MKNLKAVQNKEENPQSFEVVGHIILRNFWEFFVIDKPDENGSGFAYVMGDCDEMGYFNLKEIAPHIITQVKSPNISSDVDSPNYIAPPIGYHWED